VLLAGQLHIALDVIALGFGQAGGADADQCRLVRWRMFSSALLDVVIAAHDGGGLVHRVVCSGIASLKWRTSSTRPNEVQPCEPCISGMHDSQPHEREGRAERLAHLQRVDRAGLLAVSDEGPCSGLRGQ
jgi:hypothetical protein